MPARMSQIACAGLAFCAVLAAVGCEDRGSWKLDRVKHMEEFYVFLTEEAQTKFAPIMSSDGRYQIVIDREKTAVVFDNKGAGDGIARKHATIDATDAGFSPSGRSYAIGSKEGTVHVFETETGDRVATLEAEELSNVYTVRFEADDYVIATADDGTQAHWKRNSE